MNNPFSYIQFKVRPATGDAFIGRTRQLSEILALLTADRPYHVSVSGMPHVGKSSLLQQLYRVLDADDRFVAIPVTPLTERRLGSNLQNVLNAFADVSDQAADVCDTVDDCECDSTVLLAAFCQAVRATGKRVVLLLDECEHIDSIGNLDAWTQDEYEQFARLLMDPTLNLCCVAASRPRMNNVLRRFSPAPNPFVSKLLYGFDDGEMAAFFDRVDACGFTLGGYPLRAPENRAAFHRVLRLAGRNPYLLTMLACALLESDGNTAPADLYAPWQQRFEAHFNDNIGFMVREEGKKLRSFSHIVKCYFGTFSDYQDIKERCIALGYLDLALKDSPYTYPDRVFEFDDVDDRFEVRDGQGNLLSAADKARHGLVYTTVCPQFTDYLFATRTPIGSDGVVPLDCIHDPRDLLTGVILALRDVTEMRLQNAWGADWQEKLILRYRYHDRGGRTQQHFIRDAVTGQLAQWQLDATGCNRVYPRPDDTADYFTEKQRVQAGWQTLTATADINLSPVSIGFIAKGLPSLSASRVALDQISLRDHANVLSRLWNNVRFHEFFHGLPDGKNGMYDRLEELTGFRNRIQHLSKHAYNHPDVARDTATCRDLLQRIYHRLYTE